MLLSKFFKYTLTVVQIRVSLVGGGGANAPSLDNLIFVPCIFHLFAFVRLIVSLIVFPKMITSDISHDWSKGHFMNVPPVAVDLNKSTSDVLELELMVTILCLIVHPLSYSLAFSVAILLF